jgi:hypothetical protein
MPDVIALENKLIKGPLTTTGLPGETISVAAADPLVCIEIIDDNEIMNVYLNQDEMDQFIGNCQKVRDDMARRAVSGRIKWLAGAAEQRSYADRLRDASEAFGRLSDQRQRQAARMLDVLGTDRAPSGTIEFLNIVTWLSAEYGLHEASHLFEADLRAIARMVR